MRAEDSRVLYFLLNDIYIEDLCLRKMLAWLLGQRLVRCGGVGWAQLPQKEKEKHIKAAGLGGKETNITLTTIIPKK